MKCLYNVEYQATQENGMCFRYDEFFIGHHCKNCEVRKLRVFVVNEEDETEFELASLEDSN